MNESWDKGDLINFCQFFVAKIHPFWVPLQASTALIDFSRTQSTGLTTPHLNGCCSPISCSEAPWSKNCWVRGPSHQKASFSVSLTQPAEYAFEPVTPIVLALGYHFDEVLDADKVAEDTDSVAKLASLLSTGEQVRFSCF